MDTQVNPPTAYNMLTEFVALKSGDWVIQNGANSAVSISFSLLPTLNFFAGWPSGNSDSSRAWSKYHQLYP